MWTDEPAALVAKLAELKARHRDLNHIIERLSLDPLADEVAVRRFKKEKLRLKDEIVWIENKLIPDQPA